MIGGYLSSADMVSSVRKRKSSLHLDKRDKKSGILLKNFYFIPTAPFCLE